jgi:hypothetical protein
MYKMGGVYMDFSLTPIIKLDEIIGSSKEVYVKDRWNAGIWNGFFCTRKGSKIIEKAIEKCTDNIIGRKYGGSTLSITGPCVLAEAYREVRGVNDLMDESGNEHEYMMYRMDDECKFILDPVSNSRIIETRHENHYKILYGPAGNKSDNYYSNAWNNKKVFRNDNRLKEIENIYREILKKDPDEDELDHWYHSLFSIKKISENILNSTERKIMTEIKKIKSFCIKGERCSGTNYLQKIIETNLRIKYEDKLGWKHSYLNTFENNLRDQNFLVLIIQRNVYDWLLSFHKNPHHLINFKQQQSFSDFIRMSPVGYDNYEMFYDRHPFTLDWPKNIIELRNWKNENYINHVKILDNTHYIKYEDLYKNPEKIISEINAKFLKKDFNFRDYSLYKQTKDKFFEKKYNRINEEDFEFILSNINWKLEEILGYSKEDFIKEHNERKEYTENRRRNITSLYNEIFKREPDLPGFSYWFESGFSMDYIRNNFLNSPEYKKLKE